MANKNEYSRTKEGRDSISGLHKKYPWLKGDSPVMQLMRRKYSHPDEVMLAINSSYDGDIPDSIDGFNDFLTNEASPYNVFVNDAWDMLTQHGPMTLESVESYLPMSDFNDGSAERVEEYIEALMNGADYDDNEDSDMILSNYSGPMEYDDRFLAYEDTLTDLFDDARKVATSRKMARAAEDDKESWLDKLFNSRSAKKDVDSTGDVKGPDGLEGTKDDRGAAAHNNDIDDEYDDDDEEDKEETDNVLSDATQKNILSALLQHSL